MWISLLDDAGYNIASSPAKYPVLFTRPWNKSMEGFLRAGSYAEFIKLVEAASLALLPSPSNWVRPDTQA